MTFLLFWYVHYVHSRVGIQIYDRYISLFCSFCLCHMCDNISSIEIYSIQRRGYIPSLYILLQSGRLWKEKENALNALNALCSGGLPPAIRCVAASSWEPTICGPNPARFGGSSQIFGCQLRHGLLCRLGNAK